MIAANGGGAGEASRINQAVYVSLAATVALLAAKIGIGLWANSRALLYDGFESVADVAVLLFVLQALRVANRPADEEHPFGHSKVESLAGFVVGLAIAGFGAFLAYESASALLRAHAAEVHWGAFVMAVTTVAAKEGLYRFTKRVADRYRSPSLAAIAVDHHKDALSSLVTVVGTLSAFVALPVLDDGAAFVTALVILWMGGETMRDGALNLIDTAPEAEVVDRARSAVERVPGVVRVRELRARKTGRFVHIDARIEVDRDITVHDGHEIATAARKAVMDANDRVSDVVIHVEPDAGGGDTDSRE